MQYKEVENAIINSNLSDEVKNIVLSSLNNNIDMPETSKKLINETTHGIMQGIINATIDIKNKLTRLTKFKLDTGAFTQEEIQNIASYSTGYKSGAIDLSKFMILSFGHISKQLLNDNTSYKKFIKQVTKEVPILAKILADDISMN